jgi:hypothetical protein
LHEKGHKAWLRKMPVPRIRGQRKEDRVIIRKRERKEERNDR